MTLVGTFAGDAAMVPFAGPGVGADGNVTATLPCRQCGYDLHGLRESGRCPECGVPVGLSLRGDLLQFSQPEWVASLRLGVKLILWSMLVSVLSAILAFAIGAVLLGRGRQPMSIFVMFIGGIISFVGSWYLTMPDPSGTGEDQYGTSRKISRIGLAVGLLNYAINFVKSGVTLPPVPAMMLEWLSTGVELFSLVASFALYRYLSKLALRIPDTKLSARATFLMYAMTLATLIALVSVHFLQRMFLPVVAGRIGHMFLFFALFNMVLGICTIVFAIMYLFMMLGFNRRLKEAAASAHLVWQTPAMQSGS